MLGATAESGCPDRLALAAALMPTDDPGEVSIAVKPVRNRGIEGDAGVPLIASVDT